LDTDAATVKEFEQYLCDAAVSLHATVIAEELSRQAVEKRKGGMSVAKKVADRLGLRHLFCDPNCDERQELGITTSDEREMIWLKRLQGLRPNETSIIFVCGADHSTTFHSKLERKGICARIHCGDWTLNRDGCRH
jgi:hypothetical protein